MGCCDAKENISTKSCPGKYKWIMLALLVIALAGYVWGCAPLRVATRGAVYYHKANCPYVEKSLEKYGSYKRIHYHSKLSVLLSNRKPCPHCKADVDKK